MVIQTLIHPHNLIFIDIHFLQKGHDTTASALSAVLFLLSRNKTAQDKLYAEIISTVGKKNEQPTYQKLQSFKYMDMVIKESMRLYPPIPLIGRYMDQDLKLGKIDDLNQ